MKISIKFRLALITAAATVLSLFACEQASPRGRFPHVLASEDIHAAVASSTTSSTSLSPSLPSPSFSIKANVDDVFGPDFGPGLVPPPPYPVDPSPGLVGQPEVIVGGPGIGIPGDPNYRINACGNGIRNFQEQCDDGNFNNFDDCNNVCGRPTCGNAVLEIHEECDDGGNEDGDGCSARCLYERCGNNRLDIINMITEECDDGNLQAGDGCSRACTIERCGNGILDPGEQCDNGEDNKPTGPCSDCCKFVPACPAETAS